MRVLRILALVASAFILPAGPAWAAISTAVEYYDAALDHYFVTAIPSEIAALDGNQFPGWVRTGLGFNVYDAGSGIAGSTPVCRFYGRPEAGLNSHFYSASPFECQQVVQLFPTAWQLEGDDVFEVFLPNLSTGQCPAGSIPVYRAWNQRIDSNHRYTTDLTVLQAMIAAGYKAEGYGGPVPTAMCSPTTSGGGSTPVCAPTATDTSPYVGTTITLFSNCTGGATSFVWTGCTSTGQRCEATSTVSGTLTYTVAASNANGTSAPASIDVHWRSLPAVPTCGMVVTSNSSPPVVGSTALLAAGCTNAPTTYNWSNCTPFGSLCQAQSGAAGVQNYSVSGSNAGGTGPAAARNVDWQSATPAPPGLCGQFASYLFSDLGWVGIQINSRDYTDGAGFAWNGVWVVKISIPANASGTHPGRITVAEFGGPPTFRELTISRTACDFRATDPTGNNGPILRNQGTGPTQYFTLGASSGGVVGLAPGVDYYVNLRNWDALSNLISCDPAALRCEAFFYIQLPQ